MPFLRSGDVSDWIPLEPGMGQEQAPSGGYPRKPLRDRGMGVGDGVGSGEAGPQPVPQETEQSALQG